MIKNKIKIIKLKSDIRYLGVKENDYCALYFTDIFEGAGIYGLDTETDHTQYCRCIQRLDTSIQVENLQTKEIRIISAASFTKIVRTKVFARINYESNTSTFIQQELDKMLQIGEKE